MSRAGGFPPVFLTGLPIIQVNVLRTYTPTQIMYPPCDNDSCETTNLVIPAALLPSYECAICVDTLHYLCRVCFERLYFKGILYSLNVLFCHIDSFQRLILFRIIFRIKGGIYTNNVPPCDNDSCKTTNLVIPAALRLFQGCTICVDTLHYLCRMCAERTLLKGIFYS